MKKIVLYANDTTSLASIAGAQEIFSCANILWEIQNPGADPLFECSVVSPQKDYGEVCKGLGITFGCEMNRHERADAVISTGFLYRDVNHLIEKIGNAKSALTWLRRHYDEGTIIGASCSGTVLLAETGLLDGKKSTTSWWLNGFFRSRYPNIELHIDRILVENERLITAGAMTSYIYLVLGLIERFVDRKMALSCAKVMLVDMNKNHQAPYSVLQAILDHQDDVVLKAQYWLNERLNKTIDIHELADYLAMSYRTLLRRFKVATGDTPISYVQKIRIETAKHLLETTALNLEGIMERVGYTDPSSFSLLFKRLTHLTPREYRDRFSVGD
ncbi:MAG: helix-turn-helix domain-containing protein [Deltaproteobacteria bacterium]|nr:helix-turn-helix domain-containing protein [Candidatus Zymogenaceae bacterium]